jgi:tight adherence protein B
MSNLTSFMPVLVGLGVAGFVLLIGLAFGGRRRRLVNLQPTATDGSGGLVSLVRDDSDSEIPSLDRAVKRWLPRRAALKERLARTGRNISVGPFVLVCAILMLLTFLVMTRSFQFGTVLALMIAVTIGLGIPHFIIGQMGGRRMERFNSLFPDGLDIMVRGLRAGMPLQDSITVVAKEISDPVGSEFRIIEQTALFGQPLDQALADAAKRIQTREFQFFVVSLALQRETGGNLGETLSNLSDILRRRQQMKLKVKAMSSEARASAVIIGVLPFLMFGILFLVNQAYVMKLFTDHRGLIMVGVSLCSIVLGIVVMLKMMKFEI